MVQPKSKSKPKSQARPRRPAGVLIAPELTQPVLSAGRLRTKMSQHIGDARAMNRACVRAVAELVDGSVDEAVILRGAMWLYERTEGDAVTLAEARASEADAKYQALVSDVQALFEASRQPAGRIRSADAETADVADAAADQAIDAEAVSDADEAIELEAELIGEPPAAPAPASGKWVHDSKTGINHFVAESSTK